MSNDLSVKVQAAIQRLTSNGVAVSTGSKTVSFAVNPGIKVWGSIDLLVNHAGYTLAK